MRNKGVGVFVLSLLVSACGGGVRTVTETVHSRELWMPEPPQALLDCAAAPVALSGDYDDPEVAGYLLELHSAWRDCKDTVADWVNWQSENRVLVEERNSGP